MTAPDAGAPPRIVVMGVSASGKSSVGRELARLLGIRFVDADHLHPESNVAKMAAGAPLDDADRRPWLDAVAHELAANDGVVVACSALRRSYRDRLRASAADAVFIHLTGSAELLRSRAAVREGHFMPASLLDSQLDTLEALDADESGVDVDVAAPVTDIARTALEWVHAHAR